jgi:hypothetical protein
MALLASIFLNATNASPALSKAFDIVAAASASPSALITAACRSCSACYIRQINNTGLDGIFTFSTINLARSASTQHKFSHKISRILKRRRTLLRDLFSLHRLCEFLNDFSFHGN